MKLASLSRIRAGIKHLKTRVRDSAPRHSAGVQQKPWLPLKQRVVAFGVPQGLTCSTYLSTNRARQLRRRNVPGCAADRAALASYDWLAIAKLNAAEVVGITMSLTHVTTVPAGG